MPFAELAQCFLPLFGRHFARAFAQRFAVGTIGWRRRLRQWLFCAEQGKTADKDKKQAGGKSCRMKLHAFAWLKGLNWRQRYTYRGRRPWASQGYTGPSTADCKRACGYCRLIPTAFSKSAQKRLSSSEILGGCSPRVADMRVAMSGLNLISSAAATMSDKWLFTS